MMGEEMTDSEDDMDLEAVEYEEETLKCLRSKKLVVQNPDGTLRCPVSPSRKKQSYAYKDLLQHAAAVAVGKRGPEAAGKHSALKKYLESDLAALATPPVERVHRVQHEAPRRRETEELLVCPWAVLLYNIDNSQRDSQQGLQVGLGASELKEHYAEFKPEKAHPFWGPRGHQGAAVLFFGRDLAGLKNAQALEKFFLDKEHGLRDYDRNCASRRLGKGFYGWLARNEDFNGRLGYMYQGVDVSKYLRKYGNLTDMEMVEAEEKKIHQRLIEKLSETVSEKNMESLSLRTEIENVRRKAEEERLQLEESYKKELDALRFKARKSEEDYNQSISESQRALQEKEAQLRQRDKELQEKEFHSAAEKSLLEAQKMENREQQEIICKHHDLQKQLEVDNMRLIQKHEKENKEMARIMHTMRLELANKQNKEREKQQLQGLKDMLATEICFEKLTIKEPGQSSPHEDTSRDRKKIEELESKIKDLESDAEFQEGTMNSLVMKERASTDEIADARKVAAGLMDEFSQSPVKRAIETALAKRKELEANRKKKQVTDTLVVGVKWKGTIDQGPWVPAFRKLHKDDPDLGMKVTIELSKWEERVKDSGFQPFKTLRVGNSGDEWRQVIDQDNEELSTLKKQYGEEVYNTVTTALMEIEEYNASGRYPVPVAWVPEKSRTATLGEVIGYLGAVIKSLLDNNIPRKKARAL